MDKMEGSFAVEGMENVQINIGEIVKEEDEWDQPMGPFPCPSITGLREWDYKMMNRYRIFYSPICDRCTLCTYGPCDLTGDKRGACGLDQAAQQGRIVLLACLIGCTAHCAHGRHLYNWCMKKYGDLPFNMGEEILVDAPLTRTVTGTKPKTLKDFDPVLSYIEQEVAQLLASTHTGQEGYYMDFESKALHAGMLDSLGKEVSDMIQIIAYDMPRGDEDAPLVEIGMGTLDQSKAILITYGHNVAGSSEAIFYTEDNNLWDQVDIGGVCCTAIDNTRIGEGLGYPKYTKNLGAKSKVVGAMGWWRKLVRSGRMDCVMVDEQCVYTDALQECQARKIPLIATNEKIMLGLPNRTDDPVDEIVDDLANFRIPGAAIINPVKAGEVGVRTAILSLIHI